jgi:hypothetical protein
VLFRSRLRLRFQSFTSLHFTSLHFTSLHFTSLHFTSLHFTSLHFCEVQLIYHCCPRLYTPNPFPSETSFPANLSSSRAIMFITSVQFPGTLHNFSFLVLRNIQRVPGGKVRKKVSMYMCPIPMNWGSTTNTVRYFLFSTVSKPALGITQSSSIQLAPGAMSLRVKRSGRDAE